MVFVRGGQKAQDTESFLKVTPLIWAIEGQNNELYRGVGPSFFFIKLPLFEKLPTKGVGRSGWSGEVGMVFQLLPIFSF